MPKYTISDKPLTGTEAGETLISYREGDDLYYRIIFGEDGDDTLFGGDEDDELYGGRGNDALHGGAGDDLMDGGEGADSFFGGAGKDTVTYQNARGPVWVDLLNNTTMWDAAGDKLDSIEAVIGSNFSDYLRGDKDDNWLYGRDGDDAIHGEAGNDWLYGGAGNDYLTGGDGRDVLSGGAGADFLHGGADFDEADYSDATSGVDVNLVTGRGAGGAAGDSYSSIESVRGSSYRDILTGDAQVNSLYGGDGNDHLYGGGGADSLFGGNGHDTLVSQNSGPGIAVLFGQSGNDTLRGGDGRDNISGGIGDDLLSGGGGQDHLDGGVGNDTASFFERVSPNGIHVDLELGRVLNDGNGFSETILNVENLSAAGPSPIQLYGDGKDNIFWSTSGATIDGRGGDDTIELAGVGNGSIEGGPGVDLLSYELRHGVSVNLETGTARLGMHTDSISGIENVFGSQGSDRLTGDSGDNHLHGGIAGNDTLEDGAGSDRLTGGSGADVFVYSAVFSSDTPTFGTPGPDTDTITDFEINIDQIDLSNSMIDDFAELNAQAVQSGSDVVIAMRPYGDQLILENVLLTDLSAGDFIF
jgi:Ca2+-binding RTX toxin-like protein